MLRPPGPSERAKGLLSTVRYASAMLSDSIGFVGERFAKYGDIYNAPSGGTDLFVVKRPLHVRQVLITDADSYDKSHTAFESLSRILGEGLLTTEGTVWRRHRRLANPAFAQQAIMGYVPAFSAETRAFVHKLVDGDRVRVPQSMTELTLSVVGRTLLGAESVEDLALIGKAMHRYQWFLAAPRSLPSWVKGPIDRLVDEPHQAVHRMLDRAIAKRRTERRDPPDLMQLLIDASDPEDGQLSEKELRDELVTFLLAGHETTSNTLAWTLALLSRSPRVRESLISEARSIDGPIGAEHLERLEFTTQIIKEALRLYPPAYVLARRANRDTTLGDYEVRRGTEIVIWIYHSHRDPEVFPDPERFVPSRFERAKESAMPRGAFIPFGAGPRACIGKNFALVEATVLLASLHQQVWFEDAGDDFPKPTPRITLAPSSGYRLRVRRHSERQ